MIEGSEDGMPDRPRELQDQKLQRIMVHAMEALEGVLAQSGAYPEMPDRNYFLMLVSSTLIKATHHLNEGESGPEKAARWVKQHLETMGPLLSKGTPRQIDVQVTIQ
jgi:hypothetical protein